MLHITKSREYISKIEQPFSIQHIAFQKQNLFRDIEHEYSCTVIHNSVSTVTVQ